MNICFASGNGKLKNMALDNLKEFYEVFSPLPEIIDILVINGDCDISNYINSNIDACIFDSNYALKVRELKNVNSAISCGMQDIDSVTFSSISEDSAIVCIRRSLYFGNSFIDPCEFKVCFDRQYGIYHNLVLSLIDFLIKRKEE